MIKYTLCGRVGGVCGRRAAAARAGLWRPRCRFVADGGRQDVAARRAVLSQEIGRLRALLSHTSDDLSFIHAESVREHIDAIRRELKDRTDESVADIAGRMAEGAATYHETLVKYVDNRDLYNQAAQTKVTNDSNIKYGIVGVSLMCVFGSLALSLHPVFLFAGLRRRRLHIPPRVPPEPHERREDRQHGEVPAGQQELQTADGPAAARDGGAAVGAREKGRPEWRGKADIGALAGQSDAFLGFAAFTGAPEEGNRREEDRPVPDEAQRAAKVVRSLVPVGQVPVEGGVGRLGVVEALVEVGGGVPEEARDVYAEGLASRLRGDHGRKVLAFDGLGERLAQRAHSVLQVDDVHRDGVGNLNRRLGFELLLTREPGLHGVETERLGHEGVLDDVAVLGVVLASANARNHGHAAEALGSGQNLGDQEEAGADAAVLVGSGILDGLAVGHHDAVDVQLADECAALQTAELGNGGVVASVVAQPQPQEAVDLGLVLALAGQQQLAHVGHVGAPDDGRVRDVANDAVQTDPGVDGAFHAHHEVHEQIRVDVEVGHEFALLVPLLNARKGRDLARVNLPLVGLQGLVAQDQGEHLEVHRGVAGGEVGHQVDVHLVAVFLQQVESPGGVAQGVAAVHVVEDLVVGVLDAQLDASAAEVAQDPDLVRGDSVGAGLEREANDAALRPDVHVLLGREGLPGAARLEGRGEYVGGVVEVAAELLLVLPGVAAPGASQHQNLDLVNDVPVAVEGHGAVIELLHGVKVVLVGAQHGGFGGEVAAGLAGLVRAVVAVGGTAEVAGGGQDGDHNNAGIGPDRLVAQQLLHVRVVLHRLGCGLLARAAVGGAGDGRGRGTALLRGALQLHEALEDFALGRTDVELPPQPGHDRIQLVLVHGVF
ncbi:ATP-dependent Clp protease ATP-binding subunit ClpA [Babesia caballi]|uniref:ATP-dependent Clp protease ATP-binding subunit ClpA n=1 Tax=Babesia caballi TaxID=5871 RepID=A0AAV4LUG1_BABCB|nr:ATP-dependent Clp protease ATP-binding subunit ClpA [Babesia caballi]